jgi:hypothetical protein
MTDVLAELRTWQGLRDHLRGQYPEMAADDEALLGTLEGECDLVEAIAALVAEAEEDRVMCEALGLRMNEMRARKERLEARIERRREFAAWVMEEAGIRKVARPEFSVTLTPRPAKTMVTDAEALPAEFWTQPPLPDPVVNKRLLMERLKAGETIPGACLSNPRSTVTIRRS